jgi:hypothetical protein
MASKALFGGFSQSAANDVTAAHRAEERVLEAIDRLGLRDHVLDLETKGYTILPPEKVGAPGLSETLRDQVLAEIKREHGITADLAAGLGVSDHKNQFGDGISMPGILFTNPIFESALMNEPVLALITYLVGESCQLSSMGGIIKTQGEQHLELHVDQVGNPSPLPPYPQVANATWLLTDYSPENGSTCFVDGSHLLCRPPSPAEATDVSRFKPITAPAGSVLIWGGNTWHGALPRTTPGLRVGLLVFFSRWYLYKGEEDPAARVTPEMLARNPARFRRLSGVEPVSLIPPTPDAPTMGRAALSRFA